MFALAEAPESTLQEIARKRRELDALEAEWLALLADYDRSHEWYDDGHFNAAAALRAECRMTPGVAHTHVRLARRLTKLPALAEAYAAGEVSREHASVITRAFTRKREAEFLEMEPTFVDAARRLNPDDLRGVVEYVCGAIDGDGGAEADYDVYRDRNLHISSTLDGVGIVKGQLDPVGTEYVESAIEAVVERDRVPGGDPRSMAQRRADAIVSICRWMLEHGVVGGSRKVRPQLCIVANVESLPGCSPEFVADLRAEAAHVGHLSAATLERLSCDCSISRVIMAGKSEVLDVGRSTRTVSPAMWRALVARDRHCQARGCDRGPGWCEAHHIRHWSEGGPTCLENLELLCWYHHHLTHQRAAEYRKFELAQLRAS